MKKHKSLKRKILLAVAALLVFTGAYLTVACLPYSGSLYVSEINKRISKSDFCSDKQSTEQIMLLDAPSKALFHRINTINSAKNRLLFSAFLFYEGKSTDIFVGALLDAAQRGIEIDIILDKWCSIPAIYKNCFIAESNINYYIFNPLNLLKPHYINSSLHDKFLIADSKIMIMGGRNLGDKYFIESTPHFQYDLDILVYNTDTSKDEVIIDSITYYDSLIASSLTKKYENISANKREKSRSEKSRLISSFNTYCENNLKDNETDYAAITVPVNKMSIVSNKAIEKTKKEPVVAQTLLNLTRESQDITIQTPYTVLTKRDFNIFSDAVKNKNVSLITGSAASTNDFYGYANYYVNRKKYLKTGIDIYEYQSNNISVHCKCYLFDDDITAIGSFNLDERSIRVDTETMLIVHGKEFNAATRDSLEQYLSKSLKLNPEACEYYENPALQPAKAPFFKKLGFYILGHLFTIANYII